MPSPKIVLYFTPDITEIGRIPISDIKFDGSKVLNRGRYEISLNHPCFIEGQCSSQRASISSDAQLTFKWKCFGELTKYVFKTNDYFEIWDIADSYDEWCYFRGRVKQISKNEQGDVKTVSLMLENAAGWVLGDNSIYYLHPLIIARNQAPSKFFDPIKTRYGWLEGGKTTQSWDDLNIELIKKPAEFLETLVDKIGNVRIDKLKSDFYDNSEAIKPLSWYTDPLVQKNDVFISDRLTEMEGSILNILKRFEGIPFSEIFIIESDFRSRIIWRNTRWRDEKDNLCMGELSGSAQNLITIYTDPSIKIDPNKKTVVASGQGYIKERSYSGIISETTNTTNDNVVNAIYLYPATLDVKNNVPAMVIAQTRYDENGAKQILNLDSIIKQGYNPITIRLPFIPPYMDQEAFSQSAVDKRSSVNDANYTNVGRFLAEYTEYAAKMYKNIQNASNGQDVLQNNLHVTVADDYRIVRNSFEKNFYINVNRITWYFSASAPKTVLEWDRGFEDPNIAGIVDEGFQYA
jgi:hypothetical protein